MMTLNVHCMTITMMGKSVSDWIFCFLSVFKLCDTDKKPALGAREMAQ